MNTIRIGTKISRCSGVTLPLIMIALVLLITMGAGLTQLDMQSRLAAIRSGDEISARVAADAGLVVALSEMNKKLRVKPWNDDELPQAADEAIPDSDGVFSYTVTGSKGGGYRIKSVGTSGRAERQVVATLKLEAPFEFAVFTKEGIGLKNGTKVDWYNNDADDEPFTVGTNSIASGSIDAKLGVVINGDVAVGVGGDPDVVINSKKLATITGRSYALGQPKLMPHVLVPDMLALSSSQGTISNPATISASAKYDKIRIGNSGSLTIGGPVALYVPGDIILDNSASIEILDKKDASLTLYLGGSLICKNGGAINNRTQDPKRLKIIGLESCPEIDLRTDSTLYGAIYAPDADIRSHNAVKLYGSIVANSFIQDVAADLNYDASLRDVGYNDLGVRFAINRWYEE